MANANVVRGDIPQLRKRLILCIDGPDASGRAGSHGPLTNIYNTLACVKEGEVIDQYGYAWVQERHYEDGTGAPKEQGTIARLKAGRSGDDCKGLIEKVYKRCCELSRDDELWLFGFSRGAYVVRAVAGLLHYIKRLKSSGDDFRQNYQKALKVYAAVQGKRELGAGQINHLLQCDTLPAPVIKFVGVFDTVKAVNDDFLFDISLNDSVQHLRHALALHEDRRDFTPEYIFPDQDTLSRINGRDRSFVQAWFVGSHDDMGGSADQAGLSLYPLQWMLLECSMLGLALAFHGNAQFAPAIDDPLRLVFPPDVEHGGGSDLWSCTSENGICTSMQDLRKVHDLPTYSSRYKVRINRASGLWLSKSRNPFVKNSKNTAESTLQGYYSKGPAGTIIHPSVYSLIDESVTIIMDTKHAQLVQNLSEWSGTMLGEVEHTVDDGVTKMTKMSPNPGFWSHSNNYEIDVDSLPPLRILVCGYPGVGKSNLVSKVFGVDLGIVSERRSGVHNVHQEIRIEGRDDLILHDSKGFESGGVQELEDVKSFIRKRATEPSLADRLHVIWFCLEVNTTRTTQTASQAIFEALHDCHGDVPVVLVATKKDQFLNMRFGEKMNDFESQGSETTPEQFVECRRYAQEELEKRAQLMVDEISSLKGGRVDAWVCVSRDDKKSIEQLTEQSSSVFKEEATRLMYVKAQMTRPDLKINMAIFMAMRRYRHAVGAATTGGLFPLLPTTTRKGMKDDICRRIVACFGIKGLETKQALKSMKDNLSESSSVRGIRTYWGEALALLSTGSIYMASPVTAPAAAAVLVPHMAHLFLCTTCDLILILAKSFQIASYGGRTQPEVMDVEMAARAVRGHVEPIHEAIVELIPPKKPLAAFRYGIIQAKVQLLLETNWKRLASDTSFTKDIQIMVTPKSRSPTNSSPLVVRPHERIQGPLELDANRDPVEAGSRTIYPELE